MNVCGPVSRPDTSGQGFSLVEVLVSLVVISVMSALMLSVTGQFRQLIRADKRIEEQAALQAIVRHMANLLSEAERIPLLRSDGATGNYLEGDRKSVRFVAVARRGALNSGLGEISLEIDSSGEEQRLLQLVKPRRTIQTQPDTEVVELAPGIVSLTLSYLRWSGDGTKGDAWSDAWNFAGELPAAIQITITSRANGETLGAAAVARVALSR